MIKPTKYILLCLVILISNSASAQERDAKLKYQAPVNSKWSMGGIRANVQDFSVTSLYTDTCNCAESKNINNKGIGFGIYRNVNENLAFSADVSLSRGTISRKEPGLYDDRQLVFSNVRGDVYYHFLDNNMQARPYAFAGLNWGQRRGDNFVSVPVGLGARYMFKKNRGMINLQAGYALGATQQLRNSIMYSTGLYFNLSKKTKASSSKPAQNLQNIDSDLDGVVDAKDKCPTVPGPIENIGCPIDDKDRDGIIDSKDKCPDVPGVISNDGCPLVDTDGDGVLDKFDNCPTVVGPVTNNGCPIKDMDKDGIADDVDRCPDVPGPVTNSGCPISDKDKDGIPDHLDLCPDQPGLSSNYGCPGSEPVVVSRDTDGRMFNAARPLLKNGRNDGLKTVNGDTVAYIIYFEFDRYNLVQNSFDILNDALRYLKAHPDYDVYLYGHTDLEGDAPYNMRLSENRVKGAKNFLLSYNISESRITTNFFGKSKPYIPTYDKELAWMNRRVEIYLVKR
jgi:hypothetical protein